MKKSEVSPERWEAFLAYGRKWREKNKDRRRQQEIKAKERFMADPEKRARYNRQRLDWQRGAHASPEDRARYNAMQRTYRNRDYKQRKFGAPFTKALVAELLVIQNHACGVCGKDLRQHKYHRDHDHENGKPRGLLCVTCNVLEGKALKSGLGHAEYFRRMLDYLANPPAGKVN
jgi:hypothetical protein